MKTYWVIYEVDGFTHWRSVKAESEEDAGRRMTENLKTEGYAESDIIICDVVEWSA